MKLRSPYPWFGGKSSVSTEVWARFGKVRNYVEPFFGSGAVLLGRPTPFDGSETVNDADCYLANFWRAIHTAPEEAARWADWPVNEADLHARHLWLICQDEFRERMKTDPDFYDAKIAGWWVWGQCKWIGSGWCELAQQLPHLGNQGMGVDRPSQQLPHLGDQGRGVDRPSQQLPHLGNQGMGVDRPSQQLPHLGNQGRGEIYDYFALLAARLRRVRVCCGDWSRVCGPTPTVKQGLTAVFLDPPYADADRKSDLYAVDSMSVAHQVREWCLENGHDKRLRIALCGYAGEHDDLQAAGWDCVAWKARGGYGSQAADHDNPNARKERIWYSPHCVSNARLPLLDLIEA
jgi:hypothetical protein